MPPTDSQKRLALAIHDFLSTSLKDGTLASEDGESIEIAQSCIADTFKIDPSDEAAVKEALGGQSLLSIYGVYEKLKGKDSSTSASTSSTSASSAGAAGSQPGDTSSSTAPNVEAEALKSQGNAAMQQKDPHSAIDFYTRALELAPLNPIYLSNRAAAYSATSQHALAATDAEMATAADPKYTKAWSRLGLARFAQGDARASMEAYRRGIEEEGRGGSEAMRKGYETAKRRVREEGGSVDEDGDEVGAERGVGAEGGAGAGPGGMPDLSSLLGGMGGGGGGGGMPNFSEMMNNPMMRQMAQSVMQNPEMMSNIMNNPRLRELAGSFGAGGGGGGSGGGEGAGRQGGGGGGGGGGMPDLSSLMNDPNIAEMARNIMGGMGGGERGAGGQQ
ncbi:MAG: hypothetical protein M1821_007723 [Bathelium mastoideum]|nr:MAG: hypothetical protein M1821_007723 [Bathelium mastoideum]